MPPHDEFERSLVGQGFRHVAGVDEAGRGPLAGPVSAAAVILDSRQPAGRHRRFESPVARAAGDRLFGDPRSGRGGGDRLRERRRDRPDQHPASHLRGDAARRCRPLGRPASPADRRQGRPARLSVPDPHGDRRRCAVAVDRGSLDRRQGHAGQADGPACMRSIPITDLRPTRAMPRRLTGPRCGATARRLFTD